MSGRTRREGEAWRSGLPRSACLALTVALAWGLSGCNEPWARGTFAPRDAGPTGAAANRPVVDRLRETYPELATNKFLVVADFEDPVQGQMFTMRTRSQRGYFHPSTKRSRPETGAGSLEVYFAEPSDMLLAWSSQGGDWSLPADWRDYRLLLMSLYCRSGPKVINLEIQGRGAGERYRQDGILLESGWNTVGIDLTEVARHVDLSYVAHVGWRLEQPTAAVRIYFDDLILVDNRVDIWGTPDGAPGSLYVTHEGRRIRLGACGRFELVFYNGEITEWYDLGTDPERERNCVNWPKNTPAALGPVAVLLDKRGGSGGEESDPSASSTRNIGLDGLRNWGQADGMVRVKQSVVEVSALRAVIECERFIRSVDGTADEITLTTRYTVTPQGRMYVAIECPTSGPGWNAEEIGHAFTCSWAGGFRPQCHSAPLELSDDVEEADSFVLFARGRGLPGTSDLLCVAHNAQSLADVVRLSGGDPDRVAAMFRTTRLQKPTQQWALMMIVWPDDIDDSEVASFLVQSYTRPAALELSVGEAVRTDAGDLDNDGFNESQGCYVIRTDSGRARLRLDVRDRPCWYPMIKIADTQEKQVWAYADGRIIPSETRTADGSVLLGLDRVLDEPVEIEIVVGKGGDGGLTDRAAPGAPNGSARRSAMARESEGVAD